MRTNQAYYGGFGDFGWNGLCKNRIMRQSLLGRKIKGRLVRWGESEESLHRVLEIGSVAGNGEGYKKQKPRNQKAAWFSGGEGGIRTLETL